MLDIVEQYNSILDNLPKNIKKSGYKADFFVNLLEITEATYYRKMKLSAFNREEVRKIVSALESENYFIQELKESLKRGFEDYRNNRTKTHAEVLASGLLD